MHGDSFHIGLNTLNHFNFALNGFINFFVPSARIFVWKTVIKSEVCSQYSPLRIFFSLHFTTRGVFNLFTWCFIWLQTIAHPRACYRAL